MITSSFYTSSFYVKPNSVVPGGFGLSFFSHVESMQVTKSASVYLNGEWKTATGWCSLRGGSRCVLMIVDAELFLPLEGGVPPYQSQGKGILLIGGDWGVKIASLNVGYPYLLLNKKYIR